MIKAGIWELDQLFSDIQNHKKIYTLLKSVSVKESKMIIEYIRQNFTSESTLIDKTLTVFAIR